MHPSVIYRTMQPGEEQAVSTLIQTTFHIFVGCGYPPEGVELFLSYTTAEALRQRSALDHEMLVALIADQIVGALEMRQYRHIALLFVEKYYQRRGIAKALMHRALARMRSHHPHLATVSVHSSPYAVPIYQRLGFQPTGPEQTNKGIIFVPMELTLAEQVLNPQLFA